MYLNIGQGSNLGISNIGNFAEVNYWISSEFNTDYSWAQYFYFVSQDTYNKNSNYNVRAIRPLSNITNTNEHQISNQNKKLIKIVSILCKKSKLLKGQLQLYIYDDVTVVKRIVI